MANATGPKLVLAVRNGANDPDEGRIIAAAPYGAAPGQPVRLRIKRRGAAYDFAYAIADEDWRVLLRRMPMVGCSRANPPISSQVP